ncbi:MAG TPA: hypothetical protein VG842_09590 [Sediminibacterium sp.]|nr:hypothetical protein [Sediminibacterium sp.]
MKLRLLLWILLLSLGVNAQSDLLVLKHGYRTEQTWVNGSSISFQFSNRQWLLGTIKKIQHDSIWVTLMNVRQVPNAFGFPTLDTAWTGLLNLHVNEIYGLPKNDAAGIFTNGALLQIGSSAFIFLNLFNTLLHNEPVFSAVNSTRLGIAAGVFLAGTLLHLSHRTYIRLGKHYHLETIHTSQEKTAR